MLSNCFLDNALIEMIWKYIVKKRQINAPKSIMAGDLRIHLKYTLEKSQKMRICLLSGRKFEETFKCTMNCIGEKCNQCKYEKLNKCNLREFASSRSCHLRTHFKNTPEKSQTHVMSVTFHPARQKIWPDIWIDTVVEKSQKYNQCEYEKLNKCNLCDFAFSR